MEDFLPLQQNFALYKFYNKNKKTLEIGDLINSYVFKFYKKKVGFWKN